MNSKEAEKLSEAARRLEQYLTEMEPSGDAAGEAGVFAAMVERFVSGRSKLKPAVADAIFASRILITLTVARSSGVPISWELSKWGRASHLLELSAYCDEQAQLLGSLAPQQADSLRSQAQQYRSAALSSFD